MAGQFKNPGFGLCRDLKVVAYPFRSKLKYTGGALWNLNIESVLFVVELQEISKSCCVLS
jgi:hypothetical protein